VILTEAGERLLERAYVILREHDAALEEMAALTGAHKGRLRIGSASAMVSGDPLPQILRELKKTYVNVEPSVASGTSEHLIQQVSGRRNRCGLSSRCRLKLGECRPNCLTRIIWWPSVRRGTTWPNRKL
jgi:DNA-binding transcriptional LysR family regulator